MKTGKCPCGGYYSDWHSHDSDCIEINPKNGRDFGAEEKANVYSSDGNGGTLDSPAHNNCKGL